MPEADRMIECAAGRGIAGLPRPADVLTKARPLARLDIAMSRDSQTSPL